MAVPESYNRPHLLVAELTSPVKPKPSKSCSAFLCKSLFVALLLAVLTLFPSQAPENINQNIPSKLWELLRLVLIGIAVSYGLFGWKNNEKGYEIQSKFDISQTCLSGISHISSIFESGYENPVCPEIESRVVVTDGSFIFDERKNPRSSIFRNSLENPNSFDEKKVSQTWNSQYFHGEVEPMVVVSQENCVLDEWGEPKLRIDNKPLGLPVRSLRSRIVDHDTPESILGNGSNFGKIGNGKIKGLTPINLDDKFKETIALPSPVPWRSRSSRMEERKAKSTVKPPSHSRPLSVGDIEFNRLKSESFWSPIFSQTSSIPSSAVSLELEAPCSEMEDLERKKNSCVSSLQASSVSNSTLRNGEASLFAMNTRGFSVGSLSEMNLQRHCDENLKDFGKSMREDPLGGGRRGVDHLCTDLKSAAPPKSLPRGKSVRTIRASEQVLDSVKVGGSGLDHMDDKVGKTFDKIEAISMENTGRGARIEHSTENTTRQNLDDHSLKQSSKLAKYQNEEKQDFAEKNVSLDHMDDKVGKTCDNLEAISMENTNRRARIEQYSRENNTTRSSKLAKYQNEEKQDFAEKNVGDFKTDSDSEFENFQVSSDEEEAKSCKVNDSEPEPDPDEVDRKAGEFIAKFREQIRLQKIASFRKNSGW